jgi:hypothetical protein
MEDAWSPSEGGIEQLLAQSSKWRTLDQSGSRKDARPTGKIIQNFKISFCSKIQILMADMSDAKYAAILGNGSIC